MIMRILLMLAEQYCLPQCLPTAFGGLLLGGKLAIEDEGLEPLSPSLQPLWWEGLHWCGGPPCQQTHMDLVPMTAAWAKQNKVVAQIPHPSPNGEAGGAAWLISPQKRRLNASGRFCIPTCPTASSASDVLKTWFISINWWWFISYLSQIPLSYICIST